MRLLRWLCWCDSPHRDESAQYVVDPTYFPEKGKNGVCVEEPKVMTEIKTNGIDHFDGSNGTGNGVLKNGKINGIHKEPKLPETFELPIYPETENSVSAYGALVDNVLKTLDMRKVQLDTVLDKSGLPTEVDEDIRLARGKIMIITKHNLSKLGKLVKEASESPQSVDDLTGFWSLVHKELNDVRKACAQVERCRLNGWRPVARPLTPPPMTPLRVPKTPARTQLANNPKTPSTNRTPNTNLRAFMAQKRREMQSTDRLAQTEMAA